MTNKTAGHTPGPWETGQVSWDEETGDVRYTLHGIKIASVADCNLIAAAPDLLEALEEALAIIKTYRELLPERVQDEVFNMKARAAIKRARRE